MILPTLWFWTCYILLTCNISKKYFKPRMNYIFHIRVVGCPTNLIARTLKFPASQKRVYLETGVYKSCVLCRFFRGQRKIQYCISFEIDQFSKLCSVCRLNRLLCNTSTKLQWWVQDFKMGISLPWLKTNYNLFRRNASRYSNRYKL